MSNQIDFISTIYDTLAKTLSIDAKSTFMQMAWPGYSLSPADFKLSNGLNEPYDSELAQEVFSSIANIVPTFNRTQFENSGYEVDDIYEILLASAIPIDATQGTLEVNPLNRLFSDAQFELLQARRGSKIDPGIFYYPCKATPTNWYDEAATKSWPTINIKSTDVKPFDPNNSSFGKVGGQSLVNQGVWRLKSDKIDNAAMQNSLQQQAEQRSRVIITAPATKTPIESLSKIKPLDVAVAATLPVKNPTNLDFTRNSSIFTTKRTPSNILASSATKNNLAKVTVNQNTFDIQGVNNLSMADEIFIKDLIYQQLPTRPVSDETSGLSISFKFCRVNIDRKWLKLALLSTRNWYMFNTLIGEYSTGNSDINPGIFPLLPVSFIAICDLKITANWSKTDLVNIDQAVSFGPFDVRNRTLNQNTLEIQGLQIIAWISKLTPSLPPAAR
jgi:hypothetical protein